MIYSFLYKYHLPPDEWYGLAAIGLCKAARDFDSDISAFSACAFKYMYNEIYKEKRKETYQKTVPQNLISSYDETLFDNDVSDTNTILNFVPSNENTEQEAIINAEIEKYGDGLEGQKKIIFQKLSDGYKQIEIGDMLGVSHQRISYVSGLIKRDIKKILQE